MEMLSRRKFVKCLGAMGLLVAAGSLVGCDGAGGESQIGSSQKDVNGLLVESAELTLGYSSSYKYASGYFTIKNVTDGDLSLSNKSFSLLIGENFNLGKDYADEFYVERKKEKNVYDTIGWGNPFTIKPGEEYKFSPRFIISNAEYEILRMNCYILITFTNGDKAQSFTRKVDTLTIGNVRNV